MLKEKIIYKTVAILFGEHFICSDFEWSGPFKNGTKWLEIQTSKPLALGWCWVFEVPLYFGGHLVLTLEKQTF